ncbi:MAG: BON domain-containing protein [Deltaproteobacteria bacterium]|nr:BON domain-containing protein [Deltaproteobacteria bacterium]
MTYRTCFPLLLAVLLGFAPQAGAATWAPDDLITLRIQVGLFTAPEIDPESIAVVTRDGAVRLTGVVPTADVKTRLEQMVRQTEGVRSLDSALAVDAAALPPTPQSPPPDRTVQSDVTSRLATVPELNDSEIVVQSVRGGVVVLGGFANSLDDQLRALRLAKGVGGVRFVQNDMKTPPAAAHDLDLPGGQASGADAQNRRELQARDGRAAETPPMVPGAPPPPHTPQAGGAPHANVEGHVH